MSLGGSLGTSLLHTVHKKADHKAKGSMPVCKTDERVLDSDIDVPEYCFGDGDVSRVEITPPSFFTPPDRDPALMGFIRPVHDVEAMKVISFNNVI